MAELVVTEVLAESAGTALCRGRQHGAPVLLETLRPGGSLRRDSARLRRELDMMQRLTGRHVLQARHLATLDALPALVLEPFDGVPLERFVGASLDLARFFDLALGLTEALADVHRQLVVHKDLKPAHVLVGREAEEVKLLGFGLAADLPRVPVAAGGTSLIEGTLAYMAPEQTGRMNRPIDQRSDLYALGVILFELLTGKLPFRAIDAPGWVHCHVARVPPSPRSLRPAIPEPLSAVVLKLLQKEPDARYQSARGLRVDLERCRDVWRHGGGRTFELGEGDIPERLQLPHRFYGREAELSTLRAAFERVAATGETELVLVSGAAGSGKSTLVQQLQQPVVQGGGRFLTGKFDLEERDVPYATLGHAFEGVVREILGATEASLAAWRTRFREALGHNAGLVLEIMPHLALVVGDAPPVSPLPADEAQHRLARTFRQLTSVLATKEHPVALFLDDLQWADPATLVLLEHLLTHEETRYVLLVGAYRPTEVPPAHGIRALLARARADGAPIHELDLGPLPAAIFTRWLADVLRTTTDEASGLAQLLHARSGGNSFVFVQLLTALYEEGLLAFEPEAGRWCWSLEAVRGFDLIDDVAGLMGERLAKLPAGSFAVLKLAAALGGVVEARTLSAATGRSESDLDADLAEAVREGLVVRVEGTHRFIHDRVREAAYGLEPEAKRAEVHLELGRRLVARLTSAELEERVFDVAHQLGLGAHLVTDAEERYRIADVELRAAKKAIRGSAYGSALSYLEVGLGLLPLPDDAWRSHPDLTFELHLLGAESAFVSGRRERAEALIAAARGHTDTRRKQAALGRVHADLETNRGNSRASVEVALECLRRFGIEVPIHPSLDEVRAAFERYKAALGPRTIESLVDLPCVEDPEIAELMGLLSHVLAPAYHVDARLQALLVAVMLRLNLEHGNDASAMAYATVPVALGPLLEAYDESYRFGRLACELVERRGPLVAKAKVYDSFAIFALFWRRPLVETLRYFEEAYQAGVEHGDLLFAVSALQNLAWNTLALGRPLEEVHREVERARDFAERTGCAPILEIILQEERLVAALRGESPPFDLEAYERHLEALDVWRLMSAYHHVGRLKLAVILGDDAAALRASREAAKDIDGLSLSLFRAEHDVYSALALAAAEPAGAARAELLAFAANVARWAEWCPETFRAADALVSAELARLDGRRDDALARYDEAIEAAGARGFTHLEALALERAGRFFGRIGVKVAAREYLAKAHATYARWGADAKVRRLEAEHRALAFGRASNETATVAVSQGELGAQSVVKSLQGISSELVLARLQEILMRSVVEHAGARHGVLLLLDEGDEPHVHAVAEAAAGGVQIDLREPSSTPLPASPLGPRALPMSVLSYVRRTREPVAIDDTTDPGPFSMDVYFETSQARSVLCLPIVRQSKLVGLVYLEHEIARAFAPEVRSVLELLATQAAISLENATLYEAVQRENAERRRAEQEVLKERERVVTIMETSPIGTLRLDATGRFVFANAEAERLLGLAREEIVRRTHADAEWELSAEDGTAMLASETPFAKVARTLQPAVALLGVKRADGRRVLINLKAAPLFGEDGAFDGCVASMEDVTERRHLEELVRQSQKIEAIGRVTGSVAHDFNNLVSVILSGAEYLLEHVPKGTEAHVEVDQIHLAAHRASDLAQQLLTFGRKRAIQPRELDLGASIAGIAPLLQRLVGKGIELVTHAEPGLGKIRADAGQIDQVLVNLAANARDAMPAGGSLTFEVRNVAVAEDDPARHHGVRPGAYALLSVRDTGCGMSPAVRARLFEPFFTTKAEGKGTGLGLSTVYGIVKQAGGYLAVDSEVGRGTVFDLYFPRVDAQAIDAHGTKPRGRETILLVLADDVTRQLARRALHVAGYAVLEAPSIDAALRVVSGEGTAVVDLLLTEVDTASGPGRALVERLQATAQGRLQIIFVSSDEQPPGQDLIHLPRPFTPSALVFRVRELLLRSHTQPPWYEPARPA